MIPLRTVLFHRANFHTGPTTMRLDVQSVSHLPRRNTPPRRLPRKLRQHAIRLIQHIPLLLNRHINRILMTIPMQPNLMPRITHSRHFARKGFQAVTGDEPRRLDVVLGEHLQESLRADGAGEETAADVVGTVFPAVGS
jgi:hypothetical protein